MDGAGVFADPTEAGAGGEILLHHRGGIDTGACRCAGDGGAEPVGKFPESILDQRMVISAEGVAGDPAMMDRIGGWHGIQGNVIVDRHTDHTGCVGDVEAWVGAFVETAGEVRH